MPKVTKLRGDEVPVTDEMRAQAFWLVRRYSSYAYIERIFKLYASFANGWEEYARTDPPDESTQWYRESLLTVYTHLGEIEKGLGLLREGYKIGYAHITTGLYLASYLNWGNRRFNETECLEHIGYRRPPELSVGLFTWAERANAMCANVYFTLDKGWAFPNVFTPWFGPFRFPAQLEPLPVRSGLKVHYGQQVPVSGIWLPIDIPNACPNYLWAGRDVPKAQRLAKRLDYPPMRGGKWTSPQPAETDYDYEAGPSAWELLWEDHRYEGGQMPDESVYLDDTTAFPPYPPHHQPG